MESIRVLIADDNELFRKGLNHLLSDFPEIHVVGEAQNGREAVDKALALLPDVVLMDIYMPRVTGVEAIRMIREQTADIHVVMLTVSEEEKDLFAAVASGAQGYLTKNTNVEELVAAVRQVSQGGALVSPHLARDLLEEFARLGGRHVRPTDEQAHLTAREREVLELVALGHSNREIADTLVIAENTVKVHLRNILDKLQLKNRQQLAVYAVQEGLVENEIRQSRTDSSDASDR
jgi:two-component system NarL family response regulator